MTKVHTNVENSEHRYEERDLALIAFREFGPAGIQLDEAWPAGIRLDEHYSIAIGLGEARFDSDFV